MRPADTLPPPGPNYFIAGPCSGFYGEQIAYNEPFAYGQPQPWTNCGYTPSQIRGAYHVTESGMTGKGQTVAIVDAYASPTMLSDANEYAKVTGDRPFAPGEYTHYLSSTWEYTSANECDAQGWYGEQTLDVESVHGQAPDANVVYVGAASCEDSDLLDGLALIVEKNLASIVSSSWGEPYDTATLAPAYNVVFQAGAAEGIGFFFSWGTMVTRTRPRTRARTSCRSTFRTPARMSPRSAAPAWPLARPTTTSSRPHGGLFSTHWPPTASPGSTPRLASTPITTTALAEVA